jgi:hypothetical protein
MVMGYWLRAMSYGLQVMGLKFKVTVQGLRVKD